jgi:hypothetical protein
MRRVLLSTIGVVLSLMGAPVWGEGAYQSFKAAIYITVGATRQLADPDTREQQYRRIAGQVRFDKVYLETYRSGVFADEGSLEGIKKFFTAKGIVVSGGVTLAADEGGGQGGGQFHTFDYESEHDRAQCQRAVELAARHFDEVILDDFFFYATKSDADVAAKGARSWTQYRIEKMRDAAETLVLKPARAANPHVRVIIKYPNWYEHFQGLGFDLDVEPKKFDFIYTGTETRDPEITDQLLQQYESYLVFRYFDNIRPNGGNRGGWVDTFDIRYVDRYAEQLWDTLFAKAPEITLFSWSQLAAPQALEPGERPWSGERTSLDWDAITRSSEDGRQAGAHAQGSTRSARVSAGAAPGWARVAGWSLEQADRFIGRLGKPVGIASYKPYQSNGEDFLQSYLGNIGIPIELTPEFPTSAELVLLTQAAAQDSNIVNEIKQHLAAGKKVVITSGLLNALQFRGLPDIVELEYTQRKIAVRDFVAGYGSGKGMSLNEPNVARAGILFPDIRFYTNDSWPLIRGVANAYGVPILLMHGYSRGVLYVLNIPDNPGDLYELPQPVTTAIRSYLQADFPVRLDAPARVSLFAYDNGTFIVQSFRAEPTTVVVSVAGGNREIQDLLSGERTRAEPDGSGAAARAGGVQNGPASGSTRKTFRIQVPPHSYRVFSMQ